MWKTIFHGIALIFFFAISMVLMVCAYITPQIGNILIAGVGLIILWHVYEYVYDNPKTRRK
jgi:hypothetical protein